MKLVRQNLFGVWFEVDKNSARPEEQHVSRGERWEGDTWRWWFNNVQRSKVVVDIGASFGWYTCLAAKWLPIGGVVYSYEPNPIYFQRLKNNVALNKFGNVRLIQAAVSDRIGKAYVTPSDNFQQVLFEPKTIVRHGEVLPSMVLCDTVTLDYDLMATQVDLVKIDVEGAELNVLRGMKDILQHNPYIIILMDIHPKALQTFGDSEGELRKWLRDRGFLLKGHSTKEEIFQSVIVKG